MKNHDSRPKPLGSFLRSWPANTPANSAKGRQLPREHNGGHRSSRLALSSTCFPRRKPFWTCLLLSSLRLQTLEGRMMQPSSLLSRIKLSLKYVVSTSTTSVLTQAPWAASHPTLRLPFWLQEFSPLLSVLCDVVFSPITFFKTFSRCLFLPKLQAPYPGRALLP